MMSKNSWLKATEDYFDGGLGVYSSKNISAESYIGLLTFCAEILIEDAPQVCGIPFPEDIDVEDIVDHFLERRNNEKV